MRTDCMNNTKFEGKLVVLNNLSHKPYSCIKKVENNLNKQIQSKNYNLYIEQDYLTNKINIGVSLLYPRYMNGVITHEELPITAKSSRYIYAAKSAIEKHENALKDNEQKEWEKEQNKAEKKEILASILSVFALPFVLIINDIEEGMKNFKITFNKLAKKFATKKG